MYYLYLALRVLIYPFVRYFLPLFSNSAYRRMEFELKNISEKKPFNKADFGFEISSQGELEQVKILIIHTLEMKHKVELIFCSESVEEECLALKKKYPDNLALYRMPIICFHPLLRHFNPKRWLTCDSLIMCRYDFFPSLVSYGQSINQFILLAGTLKGFENKNFFVKYYLRKIFESFSKIITSHGNDKERFQSVLNISADKIRVHDFRIDQIIWRLESARTNVIKKLGDSFKIVEYIETLPSTQKCIFGSLWPEEVAILTHIKDEMKPKSFFIFPHKLGKSELQNLLNQMNKVDLSYSFVDETTSSDQVSKMIELNKRQNHFYIFNFKGILCEMYSFFEYAYVGGGFGESVHSLLEPFLAKNFVFCGPKVGRSTEYTYISEIAPHGVTSLNKMNEIVFAIFELMDKNKDVEKISAVERDQKFRELLEWLEIVK